MAQVTTTNAMRFHHANQIVLSNGGRSNINRRSPFFQSSPLWRFVPTWGHDSAITSWTILVLLSLGARPGPCDASGFRARLLRAGRPGVGYEGLLPSFGAQRRMTGSIGARAALGQAAEDGVKLCQVLKAAPLRSLAFCFPGGGGVSNEVL